jgi:nucleoside-diphosphate-sugar epimerase
VRDFARLIELVITAEKDKVDFQVFNAGGKNNNFTKKMIVDKILKYIPDAKIRYGSNGSDSRNYKVSFEKVKKVLGFEPGYTIEDGISELITALKLGVYDGSFENKNKYGNYEIKN